MAQNQTVNLPTPENSVVRLHAGDNVAVARVSLASGQLVRCGDVEITLRERVPMAQKVALRRFLPGDAVIRFGQVIGKATAVIEAGSHVHIHNVTLPDGTASIEFPGAELPLPEPAPDSPIFMGYPRADGRAGTRNHIAVVPASSCANHVAQLVSRSFARDQLPENVHGIVCFPHGHGCSVQVGPDTDQLKRTIAGVMDHPNVAAALLIGLGCEVNQVSLYVGPDAAARGQIVGFNIQDVGGTRAAVEAARKAVARMIEETARLERVPVPASKLTLGLQCGGSDAFSGISANPALGACCDRLVAAGGCAILGETTETFGAEFLLVRRARSREVAEKYLRLVQQYKDYLRPFNSTFDDNPSPGNKEGGLTNILEKSLGAVAKAGTTPITDAVDYSERVRTPGIVFMNTPGNDPVSLSGIGAGGANVMAFTTGRGSASGFPIAPVIKITSNSQTYHNMPEDMDINAGSIIDGQATVDQVGEEIFGFLLEVASGRQTFSEALGHDEFVPWAIGPVL